VPDYFDLLVATGFLERDGDGPDAWYRNTQLTATFLDKRRPDDCVGGMLEMANDRLYRFWGDLTEALKTGRPQNEVKQTGRGMFEELYDHPARLEQFMKAMSGASLTNFQAFIDTFDLSNYKTLCDVGGASGQLCILAATRYPNLHCTSFDLPVVEPIARRCVGEAGLAERVATGSGDFLVDPLPRADVITMGMVLHDWGLARKMQLIRAAYDALNDGGVLIVIEHLIDDARRENWFGIMASLNMLIEFGEAFDFTAADLTNWSTEMGFTKVDILPLTDRASAGIAYK
jgi:precorrin-6B methylase 2